MLFFYLNKIENLNCDAVTKDPRNWCPLPWKLCDYCSIFEIIVESGIIVCTSSALHICILRPITYSFARCHENKASIRLPVRQMPKSLFTVISTIFQLITLRSLSCQFHEKHTHAFKRNNNNLRVRFCNRFTHFFFIRQILSQPFCNLILRMIVLPLVFQREQRRSDVKPCIVGYFLCLNSIFHLLIPPWVL